MILSAADRQPPPRFGCLHTLTTTTSPRHNADKKAPDDALKKTRRNETTQQLVPTTINHQRFVARLCERAKE